MNEQETVEVVGARMIATAQMLRREADAMHALLIKRADELVGCTEGSLEEAELSALADVIDAYEAKRSLANYVEIALEARVEEGDETEVEVPHWQVMSSKPYVPFSQRTGLEPIPPQLKLGEVSAELRRLLFYYIGLEIGREFWHPIWDPCIQKGVGSGCDGPARSLL